LPSRPIAPADEAEPAGRGRVLGRCRGAGVARCVGDGVGLSGGQIAAYRMFLGVSLRPSSYTQPSVESFAGV
jgi:hypothetical protein